MPVSIATLSLGQLLAVTIPALLIREVLRCVSQGTGVSPLSAGFFLTFVVAHRAGYSSLSAKAPETGVAVCNHPDELFFGHVLLPVALDN